MNRNAAMSPVPSSPTLSRFKYYSAGKTGFEHLTPQVEGTNATANEVLDVENHLKLEK